MWNEHCVISVFNATSLLFITIITRYLGVPVTKTKFVCQFCYFSHTVICIPSAITISSEKNGNPDKLNWQLRIHINVIFFHSSPLKDCSGHPTSSQNCFPPPSPDDGELLEHSCRRPSLVRHFEVFVIVPHWVVYDSHLMVKDIL